MSGWRQRRWRRKARRFALLHGFFWIPCPLCGKRFGGQEAAGSIPVDGRPGIDQAICPECTATRQEWAEKMLRRTPVSCLIVDSDGHTFHHIPQPKKRS